MKFLTTLKREHDVRRAGEMTLSGIVADLPNTRGVYFWLIDEAELGYVGVAQSLYRRNNGHGRRLTNLHLKHADNVMYVEMRELLKTGHKISLWLLVEPMLQTHDGRWIDGRHSIEADYITRLKPRWNILGVRGRRHQGFADGARKANAVRTPEERSAAARQAHATMRRQQEVRLAA